MPSGSATHATRSVLPERHVRILALHDAVDDDRFDDADVILATLEQEDPRWLEYARSLARRPELPAFTRFLAEPR